MPVSDTPHESPQDLAAALSGAARRLADDDPLQALGMAELAAALARSVGDASLTAAAGRTSAACRRLLLGGGATPARA